MRIGGLQKLSLIDFPGQVAAVVFTQGCNFRCPYCHNPSLVKPECFYAAVPEQDVLNFLESRRGSLDGVVVSGGEPTVQPALPDFLRAIKAMGYAVKLDTNGSRPDVLRRILAQRLVDYVAMDVKAPLDDRYTRAAGVQVNLANLRESVRLVRNAGIDYQFRTTVVKSLCSSHDLEDIARELGTEAVYRLQNFVPTDKLLDEALRDEEAYHIPEMETLRGRFEYPGQYTGRV